MPRLAPSKKCFLTKVNNYSDQLKWVSTRMRCPKIAIDLCKSGAQPVGCCFLSVQRPRTLTSAAPVQRFTCSSKLLVLVDDNCPELRLRNRLLVLSHFRS